MPPRARRALTTATLAAAVYAGIAGMLSAVVPDGLPLTELSIGAIGTVTAVLGIDLGL